MWFPLLTRLLVLFNYGDGATMIRTVVSQFVLTFLDLSLKNDKLSRFMSYFPLANYYLYNVLYMHDVYVELLGKVAKGG